MEIVRMNMAHFVDDQDAIGFRVNELLHCEVRSMVTLKYIRFEVSLKIAY
jgi:hypothetical protein